MELAIEEAKSSFLDGSLNCPVGAVVVKNGKVIAVGKTLLKNESDPTLHAEVVAIRNAGKALNSRFLEGCILYTTHEPCSMCASVAIWAKMAGIVYGATIKDAEGRANKHCSWRQINIPCRYVLEKGEPKLELVEEFMREECLKLFELRPRNRF